MLHAQALSTAEEMSIRIYYRYGYRYVQPEYKNNARELNKLLRTLDIVTRNESFHHIEIIATTSPDGVSTYNDRLADLRCDSLASWIHRNANISYDYIDMYNGGIGWDMLRDMVENGKRAYKKQVLHIIDNEPEWTFDEEGDAIRSRKKALMDLQDGFVWRDMQKRYFPYIRSSLAVVIVLKPSETPDAPPTSTPERVRKSQSVLAPALTAPAPVYQPVKAITESEATTRGEWKESTERLGLYQTTTTTTTTQVQPNQTTTRTTTTEGVEEVQVEEVQVKSSSSSLSSSLSSSEEAEEYEEYEEVEYEEYEDEEYEEVEYEDEEYMEEETIVAPAASAASVAPVATEEYEEEYEEVEYEDEEYIEEEEQQQTTVAPVVSVAPAASEKRTATAERLVAETTTTTTTDPRTNITTTTTHTLASPEVETSTVTETITETETETTATANDTTTTATKTKTKTTTTTTTGKKAAQVAQWPVYAMTAMIITPNGDTIMAPFMPIIIAMGSNIVPFNPNPNDSTPVGYPDGFHMGIKTNLLYDVLCVPNLGFEFYLAQGWSIGLSYAHAWWSIQERDFFYRYYGGEMAIRKYFGKASTQALSGHHIGLYGQYFTYDFELGGKGYMGGLPGGKIFDEPSYSIGLEYGYSLPVTPHLNFDFVIGVGYQGGKYYEYEAIDGCYVWQATKQRRYFGPTKAEISLVWNIGNKGDKKEKAKEADEPLQEKPATADSDSILLPEPIVVDTIQLQEPIVMDSVQEGGIQ